jgi:hypothetical protein
LGNEKIEGVERLAYSGNNSTPSVDANPGGSSLSALSSTFLHAQGTEREGSFCRSGKSRNWPKTKNPNFVRT